MPLPPRRETREKELRELRDAAMQYGDANEVLNSRAVEVSGGEGTEEVEGAYCRQRQGGCRK